ncbi:MAG: hypothetical protein KDC52_18620, partial [Ignavibacteriae bacterium]|nr:hypothetical protein [Ignavibacteriota bacterium]
ILLMFFATLLLINCNEKNPIEPETQNHSRSVNEKLDFFTNTFIENSDMEDGTKNYWNGSSNYSNFSFEYSDQEFHSSSHSLKITALTAHQGQFAYWAQTLSAENLTSNKLVASIVIKYNNITSDGIAFAIRGDNTATPTGSGEVFNSTQNKIKLTGTSDWQTIEISLDNVPADVKSITIYMLIASPTGSVYFDDLNLATTEAVITEPNYSLKNTDFETGISYPENWWYGATNRQLFNINYVSDVSLSANHSVEISSNASKEEFAFWAQTILADQFIGKQAELKVNLKAENITGDGIAIAVRGDDSATPEGYGEIFFTSQKQQLISGTFDWKTFTVKTDNIPDYIKSITIYLVYLPNTSGNIYFDNVSLE